MNRTNCKHIMLNAGIEIKTVDIYEAYIINNQSDLKSDTNTNVPPIL